MDVTLNQLIGVWALNWGGSEVKNIINQSNCHPTLPSEVALGVPCAKTDSEIPSEEPCCTFLEVQLQKQELVTL